MTMDDNAAIGPTVDTLKVGSSATGSISGFLAHTIGMFD